MSDSAIVLVERFPDPAAYRRRRAQVGLSPKSVEAGERGVAGTLFGVSLFDGDRLVGIGRVIGDGGCFFTLVDLAVDREYQGRGLGKRILTALDAWLQANAPASAHVALFADGDARHLYAQYGFIETGPRSVGMAYTVKGRVACSPSDIQSRE